MGSSVSYFCFSIMPLVFKYGFSCSILLLAIAMGCKTTTQTETVSDKIIYSHGHHSSPTYERPKVADLVVSMEMDSITQAHAPSDGVEFYRTTDSLSAPLNLYKELYQQIRYPDMLIELEIEGRWIYEMTFEKHLLTSWTLKRGVENGAIMEKEINRVLNKLKRDLRYFSGDTTSRIIIFKVVLK